MAKKRLVKQSDFNYPSFFSAFPARLISIITIILLLASVGYLYAKNRELEKSQPKQTLSPTPTHLVTPTARPEQPVKQKTNIIKNTTAPTTAPIPVERKKVAVTLTDPTVAGTYYCYEDKANEIMTTQNNLNLTIKTLNFCSSNLSNEIKWCFDDCTQKAKTCVNNCYGSEDMLVCTQACDAQNKACGDVCPKGTECSDKYSGDIDGLRKRLQQLKFSNCP